MSLDIRGNSGHIWEVSRRGRGMVLSLSRGHQAQNSVEDDRVWTATDTQTPAGGSDYFFYMRNDSSQRRIVVTRIGASFASAESFAAQYVTGTPASGTTLAPFNRTLGSNNQPVATIESGTDITGLTAVGSLDYIQATAAGFTQVELIERPIVLPQNTALALLATAGSVAIQFFVDFYVNLVNPQVVV